MAVCDGTGRGGAGRRGGVGVRAGANGGSGAGCRLQHRQRPREGDLIAGLERRQVGPARRKVGVAVGDQRVDHSRQPEPGPVLRRKDVDPDRRQLRDLGGDDDPTAAAIQLDVPCSAAGQLVGEVAEVLDVPALIGADRDALNVLLERRGDDLGDGSVVAEVDDLGALGLEQPPHDVDRRIVTVEKTCGSDESDRVTGHVEFGFGRLRGGAHGDSVGGCLARSGQSARRYMHL